MQLWTETTEEKTGLELWALAIGLAYTLQQVHRGAMITQQRVTDELSEVVYSEAKDPVDALALVVLASEMLHPEGNETAIAMLKNAASALETITGFASESFSGAVRIEH